MFKVEFGPFGVSPGLQGLSRYRIGPVVVYTWRPSRGFRLSSTGFVTRARLDTFLTIILFTWGANIYNS
jgi:hypothetical protein